MGGTYADGTIKDWKKGYDAFYQLGETDENWAKLRDIPIPDGYEWIWEQFLNIWRGCEKDFYGNVVMTFRTLNEYVECMKVPLTVQDKKQLLKMKVWALNTIAELKE